MRLNFNIFLILSLALMAPNHAFAAKNHHAHKVTKTQPAPPPKLIPDFPPVAASYEVYVGGIHLISAEATFASEGDHYTSSLHAETYGFWGRNFPWHTSLEAQGKISGDRLMPAQFFTRDVWRESPKETTLRYDANGNVVAEFNPPSHDENREIVTAEQSRFSLDPITALLQILANVAVHHSCETIVPVFDGKRRFDITGADYGRDEIDADDYGMFKGQARHCAASFTMVAGEWKDREHALFWQKTKTERGREPFQVWLASVDPKLPELPVRLESGSIAGLVIGHMTGWRYLSAISSR